MKDLKHIRRFNESEENLNISDVSGSSDRFKKSPLHDKKRIIEILDDLTPEQMSKLVDFLNELGY
jgi:hypothetical protein